MTKKLLLFLFLVIFCPFFLPAQELETETEEKTEKEAETESQSQAETQSQAKIDAPQEPHVEDVEDVAEVAEPLAPEVLQQFNILTLQKKVKRGDVFVFRILLEQENDILAISKMDKNFFQNISIENLSGEVIFTFRALKVGFSEIVIDSISDHLQQPYIKYSIAIQPAPVDLVKKKKKVDLSLRKKKEMNAQRKKIEAFMAQGLIEKAQKELEDFMDRYPKAEKMSDLLEKIIKNKVEAGKSEKALDFVEKLMKKQNDASVLMMLRLHFVPLLQRHGKNAQASEELLKILEQQSKVESGSASALYLAKTFFMLGDSLFLDKKYALARSRYRQFIDFFDRHLTPTQKIMANHPYFMAYFRVAESYEHDARYRDYQKAFDYYRRAVELADRMDVHDDAKNKTEMWKKKAKDRQIFLQEHFLNVR